MAATAPQRSPLVGEVVRLGPMVPGDAAALHAVWGDPANYTDGYVMHPPTADVAEAEAMLAARLDASPGHLAFTARLVADGTVVGSTSIGDVDLRHERAHIGWTMWGRPWWGTAVNPEAKYLQLAHLFDDCGFGRVKIQTDLRNEHSQAAIAKLGATREGVLRRHTRRADGTFRDTVVFSITVDDWPAVRAGLRERLTPPRA